MYSLFSARIPYDSGRNLHKHFSNSFVANTGSRKPEHAAGSGNRQQHAESGKLTVTERPGCVQAEPRASAARAEAYGYQASIAQEEGEFTQLRFCSRGGSAGRTWPRFSSFRPRSDECVFGHRFISNPSGHRSGQLPSHEGDRAPRRSFRTGCATGGRTWRRSGCPTTEHGQSDARSH